MRRPPPTAPLRGAFGSLSPRVHDTPGVSPRRCRACERPFVKLGRGSHRAVYCERCRARKCSACNCAGGDHYPYCRRQQPRPCRGCGVDLGHGGSQRQYCPPCWGGVYGPRPRPAPRVYGKVTKADIVHLFEGQGGRGLRIARGIVGSRADAEDVVSEVILYLLGRRRFLRPGDLSGYFFTAIRSTALRQREYFWARHVTPVPDLVAVEEGRTARSY